MSLDSLHIGFLALDTVVAVGAVTLDRYETAGAHNTALELGTAAVAGMIVNYLWMDATREVGIFHAVAGALIGWYFYADILNIAVQIFAWLYNLLNGR